MKIIINKRRQGFPQNKKQNTLTKFTSSMKK